MSDPERIDCFLSYNSLDTLAVRQLASSLREHGISVWMDGEQIRPGVPWQRQLEAAICNSKCIAVLVGTNGIGSWADEEMRATLMFAVRDMKPVIPVLLSDAPGEPDLPLFLSNRSWVDMRFRAAEGAREILARSLCVGLHPASRVPPEHRWPGPRL